VRLPDKTTATWRKDVDDQAGIRRDETCSARELAGTCLSFQPIVSRALHVARPFAQF
jgi:hypothetical protein